MQTIKLKRGLNIPFEGPAAETLGSVRRPEVFHIVPDHFAGITPKLDVKVGDKVKAGSPLFHDKTFEEMHFTRPLQKGRPERRHAAGKRGDHARRRRDCRII